MTSMGHLKLDVIPAARAVTLPGLLECRCELTPRGEAYRQYDEPAARWRSFTWGEIRKLVGRWQQSLGQTDLEFIRK